MVVEEGTNLLPPIGNCKTTFKKTCFSVETIVEFHSFQVKYNLNQKLLIFLWGISNV